MPRLVEDYTELGFDKLKKGNGFLKPNFGVGPSLRQVCPLGEGRDDQSGIHSCDKCHSLEFRSHWSEVGSYLPRLRRTPRVY